MDLFKLSKITKDSNSLFKKMNDLKDDTNIWQKYASSFPGHYVCDDAIFD